MSFIADLASIGASILCIGFSLWMLKQLFTDNQ
jgi:hypothetical protein